MCVCVRERESTDWTGEGGVDVVRERDDSLGSPLVRWLVTQLRSGRREKWRNDCLTCTV